MDTTTKTRRFARATLIRSCEVDGKPYEDEVVIDLNSRSSIDDVTTLVQTTYRAYTAPQFGRFPLAITPNGNVFWSDPLDHVYGVTITFHGDARRTLSGGERIVDDGGRRITIGSPDPISTPRWVGAIRNAFGLPSGE